MYLPSLQLMTLGKLSAFSRPTHGKREPGESANVLYGRVPKPKRPTTLGLALTLEPMPSARGIHIDVVPIEVAERLTTQHCSIVVRLWSEGPGVIRGTISHGSGAIAHFQGGKPLKDFARALHLNIEQQVDDVTSE